MTVDSESLRWLEKELQQLEYGEVGLIFVVHAGKIVKRKKILEIKEQECLTNNHKSV